ncbi:hypothetical protein F5Y17DRAFT_413610 [Xylariaceae sp. FL0594]|nr:hypothetical protein F5Y17DRAFT_413610 [Xylariaceae sp. FL0594]
MPRRLSASTIASSDTGLLTGCLPEKLKHTAFYRSIRFIRIIQFLASIVSLALFSQYYRAHLELTPDVSASADQPFRVVEGILVASVVYTLLGILLTAALRENGPVVLRWLWGSDRYHSCWRFYRRGSLDLAPGRPGKSNPLHQQELSRIYQWSGRRANYP